MKKILLIMMVAMLCAATANAQIKFGAKAGVNLSSLSDVKAEEAGASLSIFESDGMLAGFHVGGFVNFSFGQYIGLQPELLFSMQGGTQKLNPHIYDDFAMDITLDYINIPILVDIKPFANFSVLVGPQIGFNMYKSISSGGETMSGSDFDKAFEEEFGKSPFKSLDFAAVIALQYTFIEHLTVGARYNIGLTNAFSISESGASAKGWKNNVFQLSVGWTF
ncbi:MAG: PorT family protein [Prevotellaceae bacterium]|nr:PorT family protein [Prevotellaceae bacterium]